MNFLFWNTNNNTKIDNKLINLVKEKKIDIIILAEYNNANDLCTQMYFADLNFKQTQNTVACKRIKLFYKNYYQSELLQEQTYYTLNRIYNKVNDYIVASIHFPSKLNSNDEMREFLSRTLLTDLDKAEKVVGHCKTIIIGDFNANPFEKTMISADCFNAIPYRNIVKKMNRNVNNKVFDFLYNPMWNFFGDNILPYGTYYYDKEQLTRYYWNIFDQVIIRPSLIDLFIQESLEIVYELNNESFLTDNIKPNKNISDHLPIIFNMREVL